MTNARDRVLEQALERALMDSELQDQRARAIVSAWERGVEGSDLEGLQKPEERQPSLPSGRRNGTAHPAAAGTLRRALPARAAAVVLAIAASVLAFVWWSGRDTAPDDGSVAPDRRPIVARLETPAVLIFEGTEHSGVEVRVGDRVLTESAASTLVLAAGDRIDLEPFSLAELRPTGPAILLGRARVASTAALVLDLGFARLEAGAAVRVEVSLEAYDPTTPAGEHPARWFAGLEETPERLLRLAVAEGTPRMAGPDWDEPLVPGDVRIVRENEPRLRALTADEEEAIYERLMKLWPYEKPGVWEPDFEALEDFLAFLEERPARWSVVEQAARASLADLSQPMMVKRGWPGLVCMQDSPHATELVRNLWQLAPEAFEPWVLVTLAERGAFEFEREVRAMIADPNQKLDNTILAAAFGAARGDPNGVLLLEGVLATPPEDLEGLEDAWFAAHALAAGGADAAWRGLLDALVANVHEALDQPALARAAHLVLLAEFYTGERERPQAEFGLMVWRWVDFLRQRRPEVQSRSEILAALDAF